MENQPPASFHVAGFMHQMYWKPAYSFWNTLGTGINSLQMGIVESTTSSPLHFSYSTTQNPAPSQQVYSFSPFWVEWCPHPKEICWSPDPQDLRTWPYLKRGVSQGSSGINEVLRVGPIPYDWCPYKKGKLGHTYTHTHLRIHRVKIPCEDEGRYWDHASTSQRIPRLVNKSPRTRQDAWNRFPLRGFRKEAPMMTPWSWTSSLQNYEMIHFFLLIKPHL